MNTKLWPHNRFFLVIDANASRELYGKVELSEAEHSVDEAKSGANVGSWSTGAKTAASTIGTPTDTWSLSPGPFLLFASFW